MNDFILEWSPDEKIISFGSIGIHWYSLMFLLAFFIGFQIMKKIPEVKNKDIKNEKEDNHPTEQFHYEKDIPIEKIYNTTIKELYEQIDSIIHNNNNLMN